MPDDGGDSEGYASVDSSLGLPSYDLHSVHSDPVRRNLKPHRQHFASFKLTERLTVPGGVRKSERLFIPWKETSTVTSSFCCGISIYDTEFPFFSMYLAGRAAEPDSTSPLRRSTVHEDIALTDVATCERSESE